MRGTAEHAAISEDITAPADPAQVAASIPAHLVLLVVALAAATVADGGYYAAGRMLTLALVLASFVVASFGAARRSGPRDRPGRGWLLALPAGALGLWALVRAAFAVPLGAADALLPALAALGTLAIVVASPAVLRRTGPAGREWLVNAAIAVGALVALTAWAGVAWRLPRFAVLVDGRLWRGGSTLTYQNAAAAMLVMLALLAIAFRAGQPRSPYRAATAYLLLLGVGAAASRAGFIALAVGLVVLGLLAGVRGTVARLAAPLLGAAVAVGALTPSFPAHSAPRPGLAIAGLLAGAAVAIAPGQLAGRLPRFATFAAFVAVPVGAALALYRLVPAGAVQAVLASRGNLDSSGRTGALHAAVQLIVARPLTGTGVGLARFTWATPDGNELIALYAHNEYVQLAVDLGAIGLVLLAAMAAAAGTVLWRGRRYPQPPGIRAGAIGGLAAFAAHSGFDFLWHIPVLPFVAALLLGLAGPGTTEEPIPGKEVEEK